MVFGTFGGVVTTPPRVCSPHHRTKLDSKSERNLRHADVYQQEDMQKNGSVGLEDN